MNYFLPWNKSIQSCCIVMRLLCKWYYVALHCWLTTFQNVYQTSYNVFTSQLNWLNILEITYTLHLTRHNKLFLGWYHEESPCQTHKKVGPNLRNKIPSIYTLVYFIRLGGLCFSHLCTQSWKIINTQKPIVCINNLIHESFLIFPFKWLYIYTLYIYIYKGMIQTNH
jgi:hypothetical protein